MKHIWPQTPETLVTCAIGPTENLLFSLKIYCQFEWNRINIFSSVFRVETGLLDIIFS